MDNLVGRWAQGQGAGLCWRCSSDAWRAFSILLPEPLVPPPSSPHPPAHPRDPLNAKNGACSRGPSTFQNASQVCHSLAFKEL